MFISAAGVVKYGERIWALKCASKGSNGPNRRVPKPGYEARDIFTRNIKFRTYAFIVMTAHTLRYVFVKPLIIDRNEESIVWSEAIFNLLSHRVETRLDQWEDELAHRKRYTKEVYSAVEVVLALMYDMLYTKAEVLHTWYGYLIRGISFVSCFVALLAFTRSERDGYSAPDIVITFVLLGGACALEVTSAFKEIGSTWTYAILRAYGWKWLANAILFARYHLVIIKDGRWCNAVGQYDFISFCVSDKTKLKGRVAEWIGLKDWWNKAHYTKHVKLSPALKEFVWDLLRGEKSGMVQIEDVAIRRRYWARRLMGFNQSEKLDWSLRSEFHNCVFIWHIATSTFLSNPDVKSKLVDDKGMAEAVNTLSNYMMYLLIQHPDILPMNAVARSLFQQSYARFVRDWNQKSKQNMDKGTLLDLPHQIILNYMQGDMRHRDIRSLYHDMMDAGWDTYRFQGEVVLVKASILVQTMLDMDLELTHKLVIIGRVWAEMLCYAATNASGDFHARQLSNGGEFLTHMLLLTKYCSIIPPIVKAPYRAADDDQLAEVAANLEPRVEVAAHVQLNVHNDHEQEITECR
uniref:Uncharacterized protein n=1 Tax=Avena sativa TaxID=4498 RepID=A0ACD5UJ13_AVESA